MRFPTCPQSGNQRTAEFKPRMTLWLEASSGSWCRCLRCPAVADYVVNDMRSGSLTRTPVCRKHLRALRERGELPAREAAEATA